MAKKYGDESKKRSKDVTEEFEELKWGAKVLRKITSAKKAGAYKPGKYDRESD